MITIKRVLVAIDGSESSHEAALYAAHLVAEKNAKIYLLHVADPLPFTIGGANAEQLHKEEEEKSMQLLRNCRELLDPSLDVELLVRQNRRQAYGILDVQETLNCDLIVIGSRGLGALANAIMGSVVSEVLQGATCPVLVTRNLKARYLKD